MKRHFLCCLICCLFGRVAPALAAPATAPATRPATVRCAVIGGMQDTGFWPALAEQFEKQTGIHVEIVASGPKDGISAVFRHGDADLIVMHASDTMLNLVADGFASDAQPWARNDMVIVGPAADPAKIKGMGSAVKAMQQIARAKAPFVVHSSVGAQEVLHDLLDSGDITLDPDHTTMLLEDRQRRALKVVEEEQAYTLVGRIPFRSGKLPSEGLAVMVQGDPKLRRPFLVAVADVTRFPGTHLPEARRLATFLRSAPTQAWIATFGKGKLDDHPLFFPVASPGPATRPAGVLLRVGGEVSHPLDLTAEALAALPRQTVKVKDHHGVEASYEGVAIGVILKAAGVPIGEQRLRGQNLSLCLVAEAADGYRAAFALPELDEDFGHGVVLIADRRDGKPLDAKEGPLRVIVSGESLPARWVRQVVSLVVARPTAP